MTTYRETHPDPRAYLELFETTGWNAWYGAGEAELLKAVERSTYVICAYDKDLLVGIGRALSDGLHAIIYDLIVHPEAQGRGIGQEVLQRIVSRCRQDGVRDIQLFSAKGTEAFYSRCGFSPRPDTSPGMELRIPRSDT